MPRPPDSLILADVEAARMFGRRLQSLGTELKNTFGKAHDLVSYMVDLFLGRVPLGIPDDLRYVAFDARSSRPADIIFRIQSAIAGDLRLSYIPPGDSPKDRQRAARVDAHLAALKDWFERSSHVRYDLQSIWWLLVAGRSYVQQTYLPYYWDKEVAVPREDEENDPGAYLQRITAYKAKMGPPVMRECLDPRMVFPVYGSNRIRAWVKIYRVQRLEFERSVAAAGLAPIYGEDGLPVRLVEITDVASLELPEQTQQRTSALTYYEYIDDDEVAYCLDDRVLYRWQHGGSIAIFQALGLQTGLREPELSAFGILWPVRNEVPQLDFYRTIMAQKAFLDVFPPLIAQLREGESAVRDESGAPREWRLAPGTVIQVPAEIKAALQGAPTSMDVLQILQYLAAEIDLATIPGLIRGQAPQYQAGYAVNQMLAATRTHWKPFIQSLERQEAMLAEHYLAIVKHHVKQSVIAYGQVIDQKTGEMSRRYVELDPADIDEFPRVEARYSAELPVDRNATAQVWWNLFKEGGATWRDYVVEGLGRSDPEGYRKEAERDMARRQLFPQAFEAATALARVKLVQDLIKERGLDKANVLLTADIESLMAAEGGGPPVEQALAPGAPLPVNPAMGQMPQAPSGTPQLPGQAPNSLGPGSGQP